MKRKDVVKFQLWKAVESNTQWVEKSNGRQEIKGFQKLIAECDDRATLERLKDL